MHSDENVDGKALGWKTHCDGWREEKKEEAKTRRRAEEQKYLA
jgi:hypothetical protein